MTDEEIKQNAEYFATHLNGEITPFSSREYEAYIAGAHSRDEEVNHWKESYEELAEIADDLQSDKQKLITENVKLTKEVEMWRKKAEIKK